MDTNMSPAAHVLIFPYPAQGHMLPLLDFTHRLAARAAQHLTITILVTPKNLPFLTPLLSAHPHTINPLVLPFPTHPAIPPGLENTVDIPAGYFLHMMSALADLRSPIIDWFRNHSSPPVALISDMFLGWTQRLAADLGIRGYTFFTSGAFAVSFVYNLWRHVPRRRNADDDNETVGFPDIPNSRMYPWWQLSPVFRRYVGGDPASQFLKDSFISNFDDSRGLVINTFDALEGVYLEYLSTVLGHKRVWSVGPVLPPNRGPSDRGGPSSMQPSEILSWLDTCHDQTVVYICFGSQAVLTNKQMKELTVGLENSSVKFILSVKGATKGHDERQFGAVPAGFEDRVAGRGLVIRGWAPQVMILSHRAVCAFLTHCGWNSVLEGIVAGVPMLAWPMGADQFLNATLLVDWMGVAVRVCEGENTVPESDNLVKLLAEATGEEWRERRSRAAELKDAAATAIGLGGSSSNDLDGLVRELSENV